MFSTSHSIRIGSACAALAIGIALLGAKLHYSAEFAHQIALNQDLRYLPAVEVVAARPAQLATTASRREIN